MQIFVLGTGRSGTHWVGYLLDAHPDIQTTIESPRIFSLVTRAAVQPRQRNVIFPVLRTLYTIQSIRARPRHYADKSHPAIWFADTIARWFPKAKFVGTSRSPYGTVASMLRHPGVLAWQDRWRDFGVPNVFLGVTESNAAEYALMTPAEKAALRWVSHRDQMLRLARQLDERLLVIEYEDLFDHYEKRLQDLWTFLGVPPVEVPEHRPNELSRDAWRSSLTRDEIRAIERITRVPACS